jgi:hypothetical protein
MAVCNIKATIPSYYVPRTSKEETTMNIFYPYKTIVNSLSTIKLNCCLAVQMTKDQTDNLPFVIVPLTQTLLPLTFTVNPIVVDSYTGFYNVVIDVKNTSNKPCIISPGNCIGQIQLNEKFKVIIVN